MNTLQTWADAAWAASALPQLGDTYTALGMTWTVVRVAPHVELAGGGKRVVLVPTEKWPGWVSQVGAERIVPPKRSEATTSMQESHHAP